jgi:flagellar biosynthesis/type III secretory pathway M-ring protein FliF/YscJ
MDDEYAEVENLEDLEDRDLSPITILLLGCLVAALVFKTFQRIVLSAQTASAKQKFRKRTRQEEEDLLRARAPPVNQEPEEDSQEDADYVAGEEEEEDEAPAHFGAMSKQDLRKADKKRKREELREATQGKAKFIMGYLLKNTSFPKR